MKIILPLLLFISYSFSYSQNTYVPDDNFEQFLIDSGLDSGPLDDYVPTNNINSLTEINISIPEINSLEGIQDFIALEKLTLFLDDVVNINISTLINLKELIIDDDLLDNLDLTNNTKLELFHMINTNVQEINLNKNLNLKDLAIGTTGIINLNLSLNTKLERVEITHGIVENINLNNNNNTKINQANFEGLFNLKCIRVDSENYSKTNWTQIDDNSVFSETCGNFQQLTYVPDDNFEQELINLGYDSGPLDDYVLTSNINTITSLNLNFKNISDLTGIQDFIALENLQFTQNNVSSINISTLANLKILYCNGNNISSLNVSKNLLLVDLFCGENNISSIDVSMLQYLKQLEISSNKISNINLSNNTFITWLNIGNNSIANINLNNNLELTYFYCYENNFSSILDLSLNTKLFEFSCSNNPLTDIVLPKNNILDGVHINGTFITELDLRNQGNLITHPASFLEIQDNPNLTCVFVDDVDYFNTDQWGSITKDSNSIFVTDEAACKALSCSISVDTLNDITSCNNYVLQNLINGNYYTQSGGNGTLLNSGETITSSQTIYVYNENPINSNCFNESSFNITINSTPIVDIISNINTTNFYTLPNLTNGNYYTETNGNGNLLNSGDIITSSQTVYIYKANPLNSNCFNESSFNITIEKKEIIIPLFFTPNNDLKNDTWIVKANNNLIKKIYITDRFGKIVSKIKPNTIGWNGLYNGKQLPSNTYWYQIIFTSGEIKNGSFALIRN